MFYVVLPDGENISEIKLINHLGQVVYTKKVSNKENTVEIKRQKNWTKGVYYLKTSGSNSFVQKIILN